MLLKDIERLAALGEPMPPEAKCYEKLAWYRTREYRRNMNAMKNPKLLEKEPERIYMEFIHNETMYQMYERMTAERAAYWKKIEEAASRYGRERTVEAADKLFDSIYGLMPKGD